VWTYVGVFLVVSLLMMWRLEAMLDHGLEGTALGTIIDALLFRARDLIFVGLVIARGGSSREVLTNCLVNNVTNLTLILGLAGVDLGTCGDALHGGGARRQTEPKQQSRR